MTPQQIEQHRLACEARHILALPYGQRKPELDAIGKKRGQEAQKYLEAEVKRQFRLKKEAHDFS